MSKSHYFLIHKDCVLVKGKTESLICDATRSRIRPIPNSLYYVLSSIEKNPKTYEDFLKDSNTPLLLDSICTMLVEEDYAFFSPSYIEGLQDNKFNYDTLPFYLIVEIHKPTKKEFSKLISICNELNPNFLQLRFLTIDGTTDLLGFLKIFNKLLVNTIDIIIPFKEYYINASFLYDLYLKNNKLSKVIFYNFPKEKYNVKNIFGNIGYINGNIESIDITDVNIETMVCNYISLEISKSKNMGQFQKLKINKEGFITNVAFESNKLFLSSNLKKDDILNSKLTSHWNLSKDNIEICKLCQYRRICHDTIEIIKKNNKYYRKDKCKFDPVKNIWE